MSTDKQSEGAGVLQMGNLWVTGLTGPGAQGQSANNVYPFFANCLPIATPSTNLSSQGYYWVAPFPGKLIAFAAVGVSTPGTATNGAVVQLIKNNATTGGGINVSSFSQKAVLVVNTPFVAGDYFGLRYGCPYSGGLQITGSLLVQLTLPN